MVYNADMRTDGYRKIVYPLLCAGASFSAYSHYQQGHVVTLHVILPLIMALACLFLSVVYWLPPRPRR